MQVLDLRDCEHGKKNTSELGQQKLQQADSCVRGAVAEDVDAPCHQVSSIPVSGCKQYLSRPDMPDREQRICNGYVCALVQPTIPQSKLQVSVPRKLHQEVGNHQGLN